jgi:hypothetical protein
MTESENDELMGLIVRMAFTDKNEGRPSIAVHQWVIDCDHFEATNVFIINANEALWNNLFQWEQAIWWPTNLLEQLLEREEIMQECREGPCSMTIISEQEYKEFEPYRRDHLAKAAGY